MTEEMPSTKPEHMKFKDNEGLDQNMSFETLTPFSPMILKFYV